MIQLTKEHFDKQLKEQLSGLKSEIKLEIKSQIKASEGRLTKKIDDLNLRTARGFSETQTQINGIQRQLNDADLPQIKRDIKTLKQAVGIPA